MIYNIIVEEKEKKKRHWRDFYDQGVELDSELQAAKKVKPAGDDDDKAPISFTVSYPYSIFHITHQCCSSIYMMCVYVGYRIKASG